MQQSIGTVCCLCCRRMSAGSDVSDKSPTTSAQQRRINAGLAAPEPVHLYNDSYALQAARRSEKRRLTGVVLLLDYMVADAVHSMVEASLQHMLHSLQGRVVIPQGTVNNSSETEESQVMLSFCLCYSSLSW
eukprot:GHUV01055189.1.p1 GENE.GHUV01055189.1~~GHUV01055189.1.p1  ORF type:complete len:132 (+),score=25.28 GHUV01055189.1:198-593(+)